MMSVCVHADFGGRLGQQSTEEEIIAVVEGLEVWRISSAPAI